MLTFTAPSPLPSWVVCLRVFYTVQGICFKPPMRFAMEKKTQILKLEMAIVDLKFHSVPGSILAELAEKSLMCAFSKRKNSLIVNTLS